MVWLLLQDYSTVTILKRLVGTTGPEKHVKHMINTANIVRFRCNICDKDFLGFGKPWKRYFWGQMFLVTKTKPPYRGEGITASPPEDSSFTPFFIGSQILGFLKWTKSPQ